MFKLTFLYIKTHNKTGLKYFGKTTKTNVNTYKGSGKYWKRHLQKHGYDVTTEIIGPFTDSIWVQLYSLEYSYIHNIIKSKEWANLKSESGIDGGSDSGEMHPMWGKKRPNHAKLMTGDNNPAKRESHKNNHHTKSDDWKNRCKENWIKNNPMFNDKVRQKVIDKIKGKPCINKRKPKPTAVCKVCAKSCALHLIDRWHNDNCKGLKNE